MHLTIDSITDAVADDGTKGQQVMCYGEGVSPKRTYIQMWVPDTAPEYGTFKAGQEIDLVGTIKAETPADIGR